VFSKENALLSKMKTARHSISFPNSLTSCIGAALLCIAASTIPAWAADAIISGRVTDPSSSPVVGAKIVVFDDEATWSVSDISDKDGKFSIPHEHCTSCFVEITPRKKGELAAALIEEVNGKANRRFLIQLHHGFSVRGSVVGADGKPLKDIVVKISSADANEDSSAKIHGGGAAVTAKDGNYQLCLTPGKKKLTIINEKYPALVKHLVQKFQVTSDGALENIVLPWKHSVKD
jgi:hypothetical protein